MESTRALPAPPDDAVLDEPVGTRTEQMRGGGANVSQRQAAKVAGLAYLIIGAGGFFAYFFVFLRLVEPGDAAATASNIMQSEGLYRAGLAAFVVVFVLDAVVAWALHAFFRQVHKDVSLLAAWFRLAYAIILGVALVNLFLAVRLVGDAAYLTGVEAGLRDAQVMLFIDAFGYAWLIGFVCFGIHLLLVGHLILASGHAPTILSILLALAGLGYVVDSFANLLLANYDDHAQLFAVIVAVPSTVGELSFAVWLLSRGGKRQERDQVAAAVAR